MENFVSFRDFSYIKWKSESEQSYPIFRVTLFSQRMSDKVSRDGVR